MQAPRWTLRLAGAIVLLVLGAVMLWPYRSEDSPSPILLTPTERAWLARHEPIRFISQSSYPPFEFVDAGGERRGMMIELVRWIATEAGFHAEFADAEFQVAQNAVREGKADVLTSLFFSEPRDRDFDFTATVYDVPASMFVRKTRTDLSTLPDLAGKRIAIQRGDFAEQFLRTAGIAFEHLPTANFAEATQAVIDGQADVLIGDEQIVFHHLFSAQHDDRLKLVGDPLYIGRNAMAVREGEHVLLGVIDKGIEHARATGTLARLERKWLGLELRPRKPDWRIYGPYALGALLVLFAVVVWNLRLEAVVRRKTADLEAKERRLQEIIEGTRAATWVFDVATGAIEINEHWAEMLGYRVEELRPIRFETFRGFVHPDDWAHTQDRIDRHLAGEIDHYASELRMRHRDGRWIWMLDRGRVTLRTEDGRPVVMAGIHIDISASKAHEDELQRMAYFDGLTGLANRALLEDRLVQAIARARRSGELVVLGYIDLDGFKQINDRHGHGYGDRVLMVIAQRLAQTLREEDTVARVGGDEFVFILREEDKIEAALQVVERLLGRIAEPIVLDALELQVSASIGISACSGAEDIEAAQLVRQADDAMYQAKLSGKNRYHLFDRARNRPQPGEAASATQAGGRAGCTPAST